MIDHKQVAKWQHALATTLTPVGIYGWEQKLVSILRVHYTKKVATQLASVREAIRLADLHPIL